MPKSKCAGLFVSFDSSRQEAFPQYKLYNSQPLLSHALRQHLCLLSIENKYQNAPSTWQIKLAPCKITEHVRGAEMKCKFIMRFLVEAGNTLRSRAANTQLYSYADKILIANKCYFILFKVLLQYGHLIIIWIIGVAMRLLKCTCMHNFILNSFRNTFKYKMIKTEAKEFKILKWRNCVKWSCKMSWKLR